MGPVSEDQTTRHLRDSRHVRPSHRFVRFKKKDTEHSVADRFEQRVRNHPDRIAVKAQNQTLTYAQLNRASNRVARAILSRSAGAGEPVALLFKQGASMITASLGALKSGRVYAPIDYTLPPARAGQILQHIGASIVLSDNDNLALAQEWIGDPGKILNIDDLGDNLSSENPRLTIAPDALAYINYTSGSTGEPKGVVWNQRNELYSTMLRINALQISPEDRISLLRSNNVGATRDMFLALLSGATLLPLELKEEGLANLGSWLIAEEITVFSCVATVFRQMIEGLTGREKFPKIRLVHVGGEPLSKADIDLYKKTFSDQCLFVSRFGMSETPTVSYYFIDKRTEIADERVPVGYPLEGNEVLLLDDEGKPAAVGSVGEIAVRSSYLAVGYWRQPELTQAKFLPDPAGGAARVYHTGDLGYLLPDGCLVHAGRKDFQTKIRGHRVEVLEVEIALRDFAGIKQAVVVPREDGGGARRLVAYVVPQPGPPLTISEVRAFLEKKLPSYMLPSSFVILETMPLTASGKIDRRALPEPDTSRRQIAVAFARPTTAVEKVLVNLWMEVLGIAEVGIRDEFPQLGGDSLVSARIVSRVNDTFPLKNPLKLLFETPTVAALAAFLVAQETSPGESEKIARLVLKVESMSGEEIRSFLAKERGERGDG